jgi:hypothetical protein
MREAANTILNLDKLGEAWCGLMHDEPMWPIHGQYECRTCGRHYPVPWTAELQLAAVRHSAALRAAER